MNDPLIPLRRMYQFLNDQIDRTVSRREVAVHIMTPTQLEVLEDKDTPDYIKHQILLATYVGIQYEEDI